MLHGSAAGGSGDTAGPPPTSLTPAVASVSLVSSPLARPTPPKKSALEAITIVADLEGCGGGGGGLAGRSPLALSASKIVQVTGCLLFAIYNFYLLRLLR